MKYDDASWHYGGEFPDDLPDAAGATHTGMFLAWAIHRGLASDEHLEDCAEEVQRLKARALTPGEYFLLLDGKFTDADLSAEGNSFAQAYFDFDSGRFLTDYTESVGRDYPTLYHVPDSWETYDELAPLLDSRFNDWKKGAT